jgi:hypothetical protein
MGQKSNQKVALVGFVLAALCASPAFASDVRWKSIVGVISAPSVNNPVGTINSGTFPWSVRTGDAHVNLDNGATHFEVHGLVINGQIFSGTPGPVQTVTGTVVCNAGDDTDETPIDTPDVSIDEQGDAHFSGMITGIPAVCSNPLFLIRIATIANPANPNAARGAWIATGTERTINP